MEGANKSFEQQWSQAFELTEVAPPAHVWVAIDGHLANAQVSAYKRSNVKYRRLAAACILLVAAMGSYLWYGSPNAAVEFSNLSDGSKTNLATNSESQPIINQPKPTAINNNAPGRSNQVVLTHIEPKKRNAIPIETMGSLLPIIPAWEMKSQARYANQMVRLDRLYSLPFRGESAVAAYEPDLLYGVAKTWLSDDDHEEAPSLWAGVSYSTGSFDAGFNSSSNQSSFEALDNQDPSAPYDQGAIVPEFSSGRSRVGGLDLGTSFGNHWVLSGGLHYSAFSTGSASGLLASNVTGDGLSELVLSNNMAELNEQLQSGATVLSSAELTNEYQYLSVPIKAGYVVLDRKFNITVNTGISSNFLVNAQIAAKGTNVDDSFSNSNNYQPVYFNFLSSLSFGYVIKERYQLSLEPNYTKALNNFTNSNNVNQGKPSNLGLSVGLRYNF